MKKILVGLVLTGSAAFVALEARDQMVGAEPDVVIREAPAQKPPVEAEPVAQPAPRGKEADREEARAPAAQRERGGEDTPAEPKGNAEPAGPVQRRVHVVPVTDAPADEPAPAAAQEPDAEAILTRVSDVYGGMRSFRADFVQRLENSLLGTETTSRGVLYQRRPDRFLMKFTEPAGDVIVGDGEYFWVYYPSVDEGQVIRMPMGAGGAGAVDLQAQFVGDPLERFDPTLHGTEEVAGRTAHVLTLEPRQPVNYERLKIWVDREDSLIRRFQITESNGNVRHIEFRNVELNPRLDDTLFRFTPPPDATVVERG